ncbi:MAG TPA: mucoidy inhibitor MuiA family protein, partial [Candidatus Kryptobacter bacterium]|nr:mucoidy inhibitor MuiA family protein [Candidatus Kryptobacter bacterium]
MTTLRSSVTALVAGVLIIISFRQASANEPVRSNVTAVTVYSDRALITRSSDVNITAGTNIVEFDGLPVSFVDQSLRVSGSAASGVKILDVRIKTVYTDTIPDTRIRNLQDKLNSLKSREQFLVKKLEVMRTQLAFIDSLRIYYARTASAGNSGTSYQEWQRALLFVEKNMDSVNTKSLEAGAQLQDTRNKIASTEDEIRRTQAYARKIEKHVIVTLSADKAGSSVMQLSYLLAGARWSPVYETRLNSDAKNLEVIYSGMISQTTGEDWNGVAVTLSTAQPSAGGAPPVLSPWEVGVYQTAPRSGSLMKAAASDEAVTQNAVVVTALPEEQAALMTLPEAEVMEGVTAATFFIIAPADIPSDNSPHKVTITTASLHAELSYSCVPKLSPGAFLTAKATNTTNYPFLPGTMNVFLDNS